MRVRAAPAIVGGLLIAPFDSTEPLSQPVDWGRETPRWSVDPGVQPGLPTGIMLNTGLPASGRCVLVRPPLLARSLSIAPFDVTILVVLSGPKAPTQVPTITL